LVLKIFKHLSKIGFSGIFVFEFDTARCSELLV
jgi:hypothetical protein